MTEQAITETAVPVTKDGVEQLSRELGEPSWMLAKRLRAWTIFEEFKSPNPRNDQLTGLNLGMLSAEAPRKLKGVKADELIHGAGSISTAMEGRAGRIVQVDGVTIEQELGHGLDGRGVLFGTFQQALKAIPDIVERSLMSEGVRVNDSRFAALHAAFLNTGAVLYIPANVRIELPLQIFTLLSGKRNMLSPHLLIIAEEGSSATILDHATSKTFEQPAYVNAGVEILAAAGARVNYVSVQELGGNVVHSATKRAILKKDSAVHWCEVALGSRASRSNIGAILEEPGARADLLGLILGKQNQELEFDTSQIHSAPYCESDLLFKGALTDSSASRFDGLIRVHKGAQKTNAYQANRMMLLGGNAHADAIPKLEIEANDVRCTHGATVGPIDADDLFYMMTRGLTKESATKLLVLGFFSQVFDRIPVKETREELIKYIESHI